MFEEWRTIEEAPKYEINIHGAIRNKKTGRILKEQYIGRTLAVTMMEQGFRVTRSVEKLVFKAFA